MFVVLLFARLGMACLSSRRSSFSSSVSSCLSTWSYSSFSSRLACRLLPLPLLFRVRLLGPFAGFDALLFEPWPSSSVSAWAGCDALKTHTTTSLLPTPLSFPPSSFFSSFVSLSSASLFFAFLFSPFSSPRAGCGALNTHLGPFVFFSLLLLLLFPLLSFLLSPGGLRRPKYASHPFLFFFLFLALSFFLSFFFSSLFSNYFLVFLFARLGMACSWCRSSTSRCSFSTRFRRVFWAV